MASTTRPNVRAAPTCDTAPPCTSLTTMAPVPAKTRAKVPKDSAGPCVASSPRLHREDLDARRVVVDVVPAGEVGEPGEEFRRPARWGRRAARGPRGARRRLLGG